MKTPRYYNVVNQKSLQGIPAIVKAVLLKKGAQKNRSETIVVSSGSEACSSMMRFTSTPESSYSMSKGYRRD
jgi:hypothetical protein